MNTTDRSERHRTSRLERFIGGSPLGVAIRLLVLSFIVGLILSVLDLNPVEIIAWVQVRIDHLFSLGFEAFERAGRYLLLGAIIVVPLWLISRILRATSRRR